MTTPIALDSNVLKPLLRQYGERVYGKVASEELSVYIPIPVYAEQVIYPGNVMENLLDAFGARVIPLEVKHANRLGEIWNTLPGPLRRWREHKFDWLIASMSHYEEWVLVTDDDDPPFQIRGLRRMKLDEFIAQYLE